MNIILSSFIKEIPDSLWLLSLFSVIVIKYLFPIIRRKKKEQQEKENIVDCYHLYSRAFYVTEKSLQVLSEEETRQIFEIRRQLIHVGDLSYKEGKKADLWRDGNYRTISGGIYKRP